jgi:ABC-type transport system involved in multi-copper enzyme maturation permease subunit
MSNPLRRLKFLPWRSLFLLSALVTLIVIFLDLLFTLGYNLSPAIERVLTLLYAPPFGVLVRFAVVIGVGALAVELLERLFSNVVISIAVLWTLVFCLALCLVLRALLPIPPDVLVNLYNNEVQLLGIVIGVFWKGRPYWRY